MRSDMSPLRLGVFDELQRDTRCDLTPYWGHIGLTDQQRVLIKPEAAHFLP